MNIKASTGGAQLMWAPISLVNSVYKLELTAETERERRWLAGLVKLLRGKVALIGPEDGVPGLEVHKR